MKSSKIIVSILLLFSIFRFPFSVSAQVRPVYDYGAIGLGQLLKRLNTTKSVMHIGAHPDDEDSGLLAYLARGENARTAYLSLTRGDGGQNIIGAELFESLGVIRTEELLQARRLDGAEQYFTRAFDYGFSKTLAEAKEKWDEKVILCDTVRAIRTFRPLVVISRFSGTPADGHGQHQFSGYIAPLAVKAAADPMQCQDSGAEWKVLKFYVGQGFRETKEPTLKINTGQYDFLLGRSYFEIAMEGRSQHKTQEQGVLEIKGEKISGLNLIENKAARVKKETSIFDGIDTTIVGFPNHLEKKDFLQIQDSVDNLLANFDVLDSTKMTSHLIAGLKNIRILRLKINPLLYGATDGKLAQTDYLLEIKEREFVEAIKCANGFKIDALSDKEIVSPNENFLAIVKVFFPNAESIRVKEITLKTQNGWTISKAEEPKDANQNPFRREIANNAAYFDVKVPQDARPTEPYYLESPRKGYLYDWKTDGNQTLPFQSPLVSANVKIEIDGAEITFNQPIEYRFADDIRGEIRRNLNVVPALSVNLDQNLLIIPQSEKPQTKRLVMSVTNHSEKAFEGRAGLSLGLFGDWQSVPLWQDFSLKKKGEKTAVSFEFTIPANTKAGTYTILPGASVPDAFYSNEMHTIDYPHIQTHRFYTQAKAKAIVLDLKTAPVKIGYIAGSGDRVADAIRQMNFNVEMLTESDLTSGDLSKFDTIVVGIRASQVRADFIANHQRLLDYVKNGGTLLVQYQLPVYQSLLPFPAQMGARVTDENAKVSILDEAHPIFNFPNKITDKDFENWVQERNLYALSNLDANYKSLLESHDANEEENKGGLVVANIGKGKYIYCSYAFFRQLPAGVPGAYRLFANLLSSPKAKK